MEEIFVGVKAALTIWNLTAVMGGVVIGIVIGAIPGLAAPVAIAVAIPLTFTMNPLAALGMLVGVMKGSGFGGAITAILINTPGTPAATATTFDGYPLAKQGKPRKALKMALYSSVFGDTCSDLVLILVSAPIAIVALKMGPVEIASLVTIALSVIAVLSGKSITKALIAAFLGIFLTTVGMDPETASPRLTFGILQLYDGLPTGAVFIGIMAVSEVFIQLESSRNVSSSSALIEESQLKEDKRVSFKEFWSCRKSLVRGSIIGTVTGALPGIGSSIAAFVSYGAAKQRSKNPEEFGKGKLEGIAATESANSSVVGSNMIPLLTLGIPGNVAAALLVGAFIIHGIQPGPLLFTQNPQLIYGLFAGMLMANVMNFAIGSLGLRLFVQIIRVPSQIMFPAVFLICIIGIYVSEGSLFAVGLMMVFGVIGYLMRKLDYSIICFIIGYVLGPMVELSFRQSFLLLRRTPMVIFEHWFALIVFALTPIVVWRLWVGNQRSRS